MPTTMLSTMLVWYAGLSALMAVSPVDRHNWVLANILPLLFVGLLLGTHRRFRLSTLSYALLTLFLTLHTIGVHYTYAQVPLGDWIAATFDLQRNHFDRIVHFSFGLLVTYPMVEVLQRLGGVSLRWAGALAVLSSLGLSGVWEVLESWVARMVHPELGEAYLGAQGDLWDAQHDMAAALYGALLCAVLLGLARALRHRAACLRDA